MESSIVNLLNLAQSRLAKGKEKEKNVKEKDKDEREDSKIHVVICSCIL